MKKNTLTFLILLLLGLVLASALYALMIMRVESLVGESESTFAALAVSKAKEESIKLVVSNSKQTLGLRDIVNELFVSDQDAPDFIQSIQAIMDKQNVSGKISSVSTLPNPTLDGVRKEDLMLSIDADGSYANVMSFLSLLESIPYKSYVTDMTLSKNDTASQSVDKTARAGSWHVSVTLDVVKTKALDE